MRLQNYTIFSDCANFLIIFTKIVPFTPILLPNYAMTCIAKVGSKINAKRTHCSTTNLPSTNEMYFFAIFSLFACIFAFFVVPLHGFMDFGEMGQKIRGKEADKQELIIP